MHEYNDLNYVEKELKTDFKKGLSNQEAARRLDVYGRNELEKKKKKNLIVTFLLQFKDPMIYILLVAILVSFLLKEYSDAIVICDVVFFNAIIGAAQEIKTENSLAALEKLSIDKSIVLRDGKKHVIDTKELVKGDVVILESGVRVGADLRIIESNDLKIDESSLTGESSPVNKLSSTIDKSITNLADKINIAYMSTLVTSGKGVGVVISTGMNSQIGEIARMLKSSKKDVSPLQKKLATLGKLLGFVTVAICLILFVISIIEKRDILEMFVNSISLAVAAIPEGLPAVVTIVLALGVQKMSRVNVMVKRLSSVESLGMVNVVCSDKTGTITENKLKCAGVCLGKEYLIDETISDLEMARCAYLCNNAFLDGDEYKGNPLECELKRIIDGSKINIVDCKRIEEKEFNSTRKMMSTLHSVDGKLIQYTKGAYDKIFPKCMYIKQGKNISIITNEIEKKISETVEKLSEEGKRIIAFSKKNDINKIEEKNMIFLGFLAFFDPPRPKVKESVNSLKEAGITTVMITGDHLKTAYSIAKEVGITNDYNECISGKEIDDLEGEKLDEILCSKKVFARVNPTHKAKIVEAIKRNNNIVTMTGDGVNDAPSLKKADIGIAMGINGSDVAKEASDIILLDDDFSTIELAIKEGRIIYENIKKTILFLLSSNLAEIIVMFVALVFKLPLPLLATHILLVNLLTDSLPALALGVDKGSDDIMKRNPRKKSEGLFSKAEINKLILYAVLISFVSLCAFLIPAVSEIYYRGMSLNSIANVFKEEQLLLKCQTNAFIALSMSELFYAIVIKNSRTTVFNKFGFNNKWLNGSIIIAALIISAFLFTPLSVIFKIYNMKIIECIAVLLISCAVILFHEMAQFRFHMKQKSQ